jgi:O-antigen ligase
LTRASVLGALAGTAVLLWREADIWSILSRLSSRQRFALAICCFVTFGVVTMLIASSTSLSTLIVQRLNFSDWVNNPRLIVWREAVKQWHASGNWLFGIGPGGVAANSFDWLHATPLSGQRFLELHSDLLQILVEYGVCGLALRVAAISLGLYGIVRGSSGFSREQRSAYLAAATVFLVAGVFFYPMQLPHSLSLLLVFVWGGARSETIWTPRPRRLGRFTAVAVLLALSFSALVGATKKFQLETAVAALVREPGEAELKRQQQQAVAKMLQNSLAPYPYFDLVGL